MAVSAINIVAGPVDSSGLSFDAGDITVTLASAIDEEKYIIQWMNTHHTNATLYTEPFTAINTEWIKGGLITINDIGIKSEVNNSEVTTPPLAGKVSGFYQESFETTDSIEAYSYTITSGELPVGLDLSVDGRLTVAGDDGEKDSHAFSITIVSESVIQLSSFEDLNNVRKDLDGNYVQTADIDLSGAPWVTIVNYM